MNNLMKKITALVVCVSVIGTLIFCDMGSFVKAATTRCNISVSINADAPNSSYGLDITPKDEAGNDVSGRGYINFSNQNISDIFYIGDNVKNIVFILRTAGNNLSNVVINGKQLNEAEKSAIISDSGYSMTFNDDMKSGFSFEVIINQNQNPDGNQGGIIPPDNPKKISVSLDSPEGLCQGVRIDGRDVDSATNSVSVEDGLATRDISICLEFGKGISKIKINGTEISDIPDDEEGWITFKGIADADSYDIELFEGESDDITMLWVYDQATADKNGFGKDAVVENGKVELVSVNRNGESLDVKDVAGENGGYVMLKKGDDITVRLIPDYGYQLKSVSVNNQELEPQDDVSTFVLSNLQGNIHFSGVFVKSEDIVSSTSNIVTSPEILDGANAASSGNLSLSIMDNKSYSKDVSSALTGSDVEVVAALDLTLDNIVSKGNGENWTTNITEFDKPISVSVNVSDDALENDETYGIVRDHNGILTELDTTYEDGKLSFKTNKFSTYTLVKKTTNKNSVPKSDNKNNNANKVTSPKTGEKASSNIRIILMILGICIIELNAMKVLRIISFK